MNRTELEHALKNMSKDKFTDFVKDFGGSHESPDSITRNYIDNPEWEPRLCQLLGFLTEEERKTQAAIKSASASKWSAIASAVSAVIALLALLLAFFVSKGCQEKVQPTASSNGVTAVPEP